MNNNKQYITVYSDLKPKEQRQLNYKRRFKKEKPSWDETLVYLAKKFSELTPQNSIILDAGCGNGNYVIDENRNRINKAIGIDVDKDATSKNICLDEIHIGNLESMPFPDLYFDACVNLWVLEHVNNAEKVFKEIHRVLKPNGKFLFATPNKNFLPLKLIKILKSDKVDKELNKKLFDRESEDVFDTTYAANTVKEIQAAADEYFNFDELFYNSDPSYTSFNTFSYKASYLIDSLLNKIGVNFFKPHIIGVLSKK